MKQIIHILTQILQAIQKDQAGAVNSGMYDRKQAMKAVCTTIGATLFDEAILKTGTAVIKLGEKGKEFYSIEEIEKIPILLAEIARKEHAQMIGGAFGGKIGGVSIHNNRPKRDIIERNHSLKKRINGYTGALKAKYGTE